MDLGSCSLASYPRLLFIVTLIFSTCFQLTTQNVRQKRAATRNEPSIVTQDGHMIFQTGTNHNITFQSSNGGFININGKNLDGISQKVQDNSAAISQLQSNPAVPPDLVNRVTQVESRLNNLVPTGEVANKFRDLTTRMTSLERNVPADINSRLGQVESGIANLRATGEVASRLTEITGRVANVENSVQNVQNSLNGGRVLDRVNTLQSTLTTLQQTLNTDDCVGYPCRHGGTCIDMYNSFFCLCPKEWTSRRCDVDVNECEEFAGSDLGCQNGGTCENYDGGYRCRCPPNWHGGHCTSRHDDCNGASNEAICGHGTCVNKQRIVPNQPKYTCICEQGWTAGDNDPACTEDVDECNTAIQHCSVDPPVQCFNYPGSFQCGPCPTGYSGNGHTCSDINECATNNGGCSRAPYVECINTRGSRTCGACPPGYQGNGVTCTWVGVCSQNNGGCNQFANCVENQGIAPSYRVCHCRPGYTGNGVGPSGCVPQTASGACATPRCQNGGICVETSTSFTCNCQAGYTGTTCQTNINDCASRPCQNGGVCLDRINGFVCNCTEQWSGTTCTERQEICGGALRGESGTLRYPQQPNANYPHGQSCAWSITTTRRKIIILTFTRFNLESHVRCNYDFLQIHDGPTASSHQIGQYCGNVLPNNGTINSTHHQLYLWFKTDASVSRDGFTLSWTSADPVCGGDIAADYGTIESPGYPGRYPHNRDCVWTVSVPPGNNIMFTFATLSLENHDDCQYDYLEFRDGLLDSSPVLNRYCSTLSPPPLSTTGPYAWVKFHSDASANDVGFHITFTKVPGDAQCGGALTNVSGSFSSPGFPTPYQHNAQCVWTITLAAGETVSLTFTAMDLEEHNSCFYDYVEVRDGADEEADLIGRYCDNVPAVLSSTGNQMWVKFRSDASMRGSGFRATYTTACGGTYTTPSGTLSSPNFPGTYPRNKQCTYLISQPEGFTITISFTAFDFEGSSPSSCTYDYVEVFDGGNEDGTALGRYCSNQIPEDVSSTGNVMFIKFVTDGSIQRSGFSAGYTTNEGGQDCGGTLTDDTGSFESPGHPNNYPHGANCTWYISVDQGSVIRLTFNAFSLESHTRCRYDSVEIFDNSTLTDLGNSLGKYCGSSGPPVLTSTGNTMAIQLVSDGSIASGGFTASYVTMDASAVCGSELRTSIGVITSPDYPASYPHTRECVWTIVVGAGQQILLNVTNFQLESHPNCNYDFLEIRNGGFNTSPLIGKYCGTTIDTLIRSHSNRLYIRFKSDSSQTAPGFRIVYDGTASGCGADLTTPSGSFVSPNYPVAYHHRGECYWTITTSRGSKIQLVFVDMDLESHSDCRYDYVQARDDDSTGVELGTVCGAQIPSPILSNSNRMWVKFRSDGSVSGRGFHAAYYSQCNAVLTDHSGVIESPNFPNQYPHRRNCTWVIQATLGNTINASFSHFDVETHSTCQYDYVQLRDGQDETAPVISTSCGTDIPASVATTQQYLWVHFQSDASVAGIGFRLEYIMDGCGGYLTDPTGRFTSPNYPNPYPHRRVCEWYITVATGSAVKLTITNFDVEAHSDCRFDSLMVYGGIDDTAPMLTNLCSRISSPQILTSTGNRMFVRFTSDISVNGNGFEVTYETVTGGCGGNFTAENGLIVSKNYPSNYPDNTDCEWLITLQEGQLVVLTFQDFDVEGTANSNCNFDYVAVYDGNNQNATELIRHCGNALPSNPILRSSGNQMFIRMRADGSVNKKGFKAQYVKGCGGTLDADVAGGVLTSPNYPDLYDMASNCTWLLRAQSRTERITLTFTHMDIEDVSDCSRDYVQILDGDSGSAPELYTLCGNTIPSPITSQGSALYVIFSSDRSGQRSGFRATYTTSVSTCGGDFTSESGAFNSPNYPNSYPVSTECVWTITASPGNQILVSFSMFELEQHINCQYDYLEMREGSDSGRLIGRYCGSDLPSNVTASNRIYMKFVSDGSATGVGFMADYNTLYGGVVTGSSGQIASPRYPQQYPHNADYTWTITTAVNSRIRITFIQLDMEGAINCAYDYVRFRAGGDGTGPILNSFCGTELPTSFVSTTNQLFVEFHSDFSSSGSGFLFNWAVTSDQPLSTTTVGPSTTPVLGCGGELVAVDGGSNFTSPGYPSNYPSNANCTWEISATPGHRIWFNLTDLYMESHTRCNYDVITVYDALYSTGRYRGSQVGRFCGREKNDEPIVASGNRMTVTFTSDGSVSRRGFAADFKSVCGGIIRNVETGEIHSPNYPNNYDSNVNCTWVISVPPGRTIQTTFNAFNIQSSSGCNNDYLLLLNGNNINSPPLQIADDGRLCGISTPTVGETQSNSLYLSFISDNARAFPGFSLTWSEVRVTCGGSLILSSSVTSGVFSSPNYPANYPHNVDCVWVITAPASESIQIDFTSNFYIENHSNCQFDYIEFRDGGTENANLIGSYCGRTAPGTIRSNGNVLYARFRTDNSVPHVGFQANYKIATCGGTIIGDSGSVMSPNYPSAYDNNAVCEWIIRAPVGHYITFTFEAFSLPTASNCSRSDFVEIREMNSTGDWVLRPSCGSTTPNAVDTSDSIAYIRFKTDSSGTQTGFKLNFQASVEECGGDLVTPTGTFTSPNYPGLYAHSRVCEWRIRVQPGRRVTLNFNDFQLEASTTCRWDRVDVFNGLLINSPRIARLCGGSARQIESSGNTMLVRFRTDGSVSNGGFSATYTSNEDSSCGGNFMAGSGNITSPGYQNGNYTNNEQCIWVIQNRNPVNSSISLRFLDFSLEPHVNCIFDYLEVREGTNENGALFGRYCGNSTVPAPVVSPSPNLWVRFKSDASLAGRGFDIQYSSTACGGLLTSDNGVITSPNYPANYNHGDFCSWLIQAPEGSQVVVTFDDIGIEQHPQCNYDYVEILNGGLASSPSIAKYCGTTPPASFSSQSHQIRVNFRTDSSSAGRGFKISYSFSTGGCGGLYHSNTGTITSPGFPNNYPHNTECVWTITVQPGYHVSVAFNSPFAIETHSNCRFDYVQFYDILPNRTQSAIGPRYCGSDIPGDQVSSGNQLAVKMHTDSSSSGAGFSANWTTGCGATFTSDTGLILSPGFPNNYANNLQCNYTILIDPQRFILLHFDESNFDIEDHVSCRYDSLQVYGGNDTSGRSLGKFCGTTAPQDLSSRGSMFIQFNSDSSRVGTGFRLAYSVSECGGVYTEPNGEISSPTHPTNYHSNLNCTYNITVADNTVVELKFNTFDIELHSRCNFDYVEVRDGNSFDSPLIGRYCGSSIPDTIKSSGSSLLVNFVTDRSVTRAGFQASYRQTLGVSQGCGGMFNTSSGRIGSPDIDRNGEYDSGLDCIWRFIVSPNKVIQFTVPTLNLEYENNCNYDFLEIHDGMTAQDPLVGKICGQQTNYQFTASTNALYVRFYSDGSVSGAGFNASYTEVNPFCGGTFNATNSSQTINSPSYPVSRVEPVRCRWVIDSPNNQQVRVHVNSFNIGDTGDCNYNYLEIRDSPLGESGRTIHYCGSNIPPDFDSAGRTLQINLIVSRPQQTSSFQLTYSIAECNRTYSGDNGRILSPGWPDSYPHNADCAITINSPPGSMITLYFNNFRIETHPRCNYDYLQVYNGSDFFAPSVGRYCGSVLPDPIFVGGNNVALRFKTDRSVAFAGFDISYTSSPLGMGCGGNLTSVNGSFTSPNYPGNYTLGQTCDWYITVPARRSITLNFADMGILGSPDCSTDYVEVRKGVNSLLVGTYCGDSTVAELRLGTNKAFVRYVSDGQASAVYFRAVFNS